jgi:imidazolonepropionase-like amidohydrolase
MMRTILTRLITTARANRKATARCQSEIPWLVFRPFRSVPMILIVCLLLPATASSQTARVAGIREHTPSVFALKNARIITAPGTRIRRGTLVVRDGVIEDVGRRAVVEIPADAWVVDLTGRTVYPGFIDVYTRYGLPETMPRDEQIHWNPQIRSHDRCATDFKPDVSLAASLRSQGFVAVQCVPAHGLIRGLSTAVGLGDGDANRQIARPDVLHSLSFRRSAGSPGGYPTSMMGAVALLRQTFLDAQWYEKAQQAFAEQSGLPRPETNLALDALATARKQGTPFMIETDDENGFWRASALAQEFDLNVWVRGSGKEYRRLQAVRETNLPVIVPVDFPKPPEVGTPEAAMTVALETLRQWYFAPENPARLAGAGVRMVLTSHGSGNAFLNNLRTAVDRGLSPEEALAALTIRPAEMLGIEHRYGTLEKGKAASFFVTDGSLFDPPTKIIEVWVDGQRYAVEAPVDDPKGAWEVDGFANLSGAVLRITGSVSRLRGEIEYQEKSTRLEQLKLDGPRLTMRFQGDAVGREGLYRLSAHLGQDQLLGAGETNLGEFFTWTAARIEAEEEEEQEEKKSPAPATVLDLPERFPSMEYGFAAIPRQPEVVLIKNATIWTQGPEGLLVQADLLVTQGVISRTGRDIAVPRDALVIDAGGWHVTPGLIDPHLHTSILGGVNETGDAITSETRIADVLNGDNVWIYRLLAGGITSAALLHGSANPIGGQNAVIKMRWGQLPDELLIEDASPGLKMALGENVKQAPTRYPNTRQGTEQLIRDALQAAVEYGESLERQALQPHGTPVRRDLQLEAILEVIQGRRKVHVHAYRQDEMLMMLRVAEDFGFTIASFEHTLEGYKIADELRDHGAAAVVWTDWSSFKVEAQDGILYNARLLDQVGVLTSLHSDNTLLSTRMNWEAAKTMKTGVGEIQAMNFITLHPAKILGIDHRTGSLEAGKDADFVIWSGHPLSSFSIPLQTWVDGRKYFDREEDLRLREAVREERARIITRVLGQRHGDTNDTPEKDD